MTDISMADAKLQIAFVAANFKMSYEAQYTKVGKWFSKEPLSTFERECLGILLSDIHAFKAGECYMNAGKIAMRRSALTFCEGLAAGFWPVPHAWVSYKGRAIDVTWPAAWTPRHTNKRARSVEAIMQRVEHNLKSCSYLGVEVPTPIINAHFMKHRKYTPLFDASHARQWPEFEKMLTDRKFPATIDSGE